MFLSINSGVSQIQHTNIIPHPEQGRDCIFGYAYCHFIIFFLLSFSVTGTGTVTGRSVKWSLSLFPHSFPVAHLVSLAILHV